MPKYVVEMIHQYEIETPDIRSLTTNYEFPNFSDTNAVSVEYLDGKVTYFMTNDKDEN